jgi:hypothetical protein
MTRDEAYREWRMQEPQKTLVDYLFGYYRGRKDGSERYPNGFLDSLIEDRLRQHRPLSEAQLKAGIRTMERRQWASSHEHDTPAESPTAPSGPYLTHEGAQWGVFKHNGETVVVKPNKKGTHSYANRVVACPPRVNKFGATVKWELDYAPHLIEKLTEADRASEEDVRSFLIQYGRCVCGRPLKRDRSVRIMMGPRCAKKYGVKW